MSHSITFTIRSTEPGDYPALQRIYASPRVIWGTLQLPFPSVEKWRKRIAEPDQAAYSLVACVDDEVIGNVDLFTAPTRPRRRHAGRVGMAVRDDWQGRGAGSALMQAALDLADNWLNLERIELEVYVDNEPAVRLYRKFGFAVEGTMIRYAYRDGRYVDTYAMARLREHR